MESLAAERPAALSRYLPAIEAALKAAVGQSGSPLDRASRYVLGWEDEHGGPANAAGKRIRPSLCLAAAEAFGGGVDGALSGAIAVELVHNFSLVHDDIQDHDRERHGRPTLWVLHGEAQAINAGDYLYTLALRTLTGAPAPAERRIAALQVLNTAIAAMIGGQWADIGFETTNEVSVDAYLAMVAGKTGALLGAPLEIGAILAGADPEAAMLAGEWGQAVGLAFQAQDDYLGIWGDSAQTGKSTSSDIVRKKRTLPILLGMEHPEAGPVLRAAFAADHVSASDATAVADALRAAGADIACQDLARQEVTRAEELLSQLPIAADARSELRQVGTFLVERNH
jgi:geranylgeranyl diphosphate synthase type I